MRFPIRHTLSRNIYMRIGGAEAKLVSFSFKYRIPAVRLATGLILIDRSDVIPYIAGFVGSTFGVSTIFDLSDGEGRFFPRLWVEEGRACARTVRD